MVRHWNRAVLEFPSLEVFKKCPEGLGLVLGLAVLMGQWLDSGSFKGFSNGSVVP